MIGFTDKALILCPSPDMCDGKPYTYKNNFRAAIQSIITYCNENSMEPYSLLTDEVAIESCTGVQWLRTLGRGDMYFMQQNNEVFSHTQSLQVVDLFPDAISNALQKVPMPEGKITPDQRFDVVVKRERKAVNAMLKKFKFIFNIQFSNSKQYKPVTKEGDGRIVVNVDARTFMATAEISGTQVPIAELLDLGCANLPVNTWRF